MKIIVFFYENKIIKSIKNYLNYLFIDANHRTNRALFLILGTLVVIGGTFYAIKLRLFPLDFSILKFNNQIYKLIIVIYLILVIFYFFIPIMIGGFGNWFMSLILYISNKFFAKFNNLIFWLLVLWNVFTKWKKEVKIFLNNSILNFIKNFNNYNKFTFIIFNIFIISIFIFLFYINIPKFHCLDEIRESDHIYLTKLNIAVYISYTSPLAELFLSNSFDELEKKIPLSYYYASQPIFVLKNPQAIIRDLNNFRFDNNFPYRPEEFNIKKILNKNNVYHYKLENRLRPLVKDKDYLEKMYFRKILSHYKREEGVFDYEMDLSLGTTPDLSSDVIFFEQFVKKEIAKITEKGNAEDIKGTINAVKKAILNEKIALRNINEFNFGIFSNLSKKITDKIINFEVCYDYFIKEYRKNPTYIKVLLEKKKIKERFDILNAVKILRTLKDRKTFEEIYGMDPLKDSDFIRNIDSQSNKYITPYFMCKIFNSKVFYSGFLNGAKLVYAPNDILHSNKLIDHIWFEIKTNPLKQTELSFYYNKRDNLDKYLLFESNYIFKIDSESFKSEFGFDEVSRSNYYAKFVSNKKTIETRFSVLEEDEVVEIMIIDNNNAFYYKIDLLNNSILMQNHYRKGSSQFKNIVKA